MTLFCAKCETKFSKLKLDPKHRENAYALQLVEKAHLLVPASLNSRESFQTAVEDIETLIWAYRKMNANPDKYPRTGFEPIFYWTGDLLEDAWRINIPHYYKEGKKENRFHHTKKLMMQVKGYDRFTLTDALNLQAEFLKKNNWRGVTAGIRTFNTDFDDTPDFLEVKDQIEPLFPVCSKDFSKKSEFLKWYHKVMTIHPLGDLNGRVFGIIIAILYDTWLNTER